jgi:hypothetical protein
MALASWDLSGAENFEMGYSFSENVSIPVLEE